MQPHPIRPLQLKDTTANQEPCDAYREQTSRPQSPLSTNISLLLYNFFRAENKMPPATLLPPGAAQIVAWTVVLDQNRHHQCECTYKIEVMKAFLDKYFSQLFVARSGYIRKCLVTGQWSALLSSSVTRRSLSPAQRSQETTDMMVLLGLGF